MKKRLSILPFKITISSIIGISLIYFLLIESSFPFSENGGNVEIFFYSKYLISPLIIIYSFLPFKNHKINRRYAKTCDNIQKYLLIPWVIVLFFSIISWTCYRPSFNYITRGFSNLIYVICSIMLGVSLFKIFGFKVLKYLVIAICLMYITNYALGCYANGPIFLLKLFDFSCIDSKILKYKELHELSYMSGILLIWSILNGNKKHFINKIWIIIMLLGMIFSFKRIGLFAFLIVLIYILIYTSLRRNTKVKYINLSKIVLFAVSLLYIFLIGTGLFKMIVEKIGLNVMGRDIIYSYFRNFIDISPTFIGKGVGFVSRQFNYITVEDVGYIMFQLKQGLNNDFYRIYIEIGMIGTIVWLSYLCFLFPKIIDRKYGIRCTLFLISFLIYSFITYMTDNTLSYFMYQFTFSIILVDLVLKEKKHKDKLKIEKNNKLRQECLCSN